MGAPDSEHNPAVAPLPAGVRENNGACCCFLVGTKTVPNEVPFVRFYPLLCLFFSNREVRGCLVPMRSDNDERHFALLEGRTAPRARRRNALPEAHFRKPLL
ncbi:hypothetical protein TRVL_09599 [Trypanosoma vivax]|nr:hypothetical protein TRVL_09599 [Trypanosoma vivax]